MSTTDRMALSATLHCLTGCAIGEILGLMIGTAMGLSSGATIALAVALAFLFGYLLSTIPLVQAGLGFAAALSLVLAADTLSILTMEVVDNAVMAAIPGAMDSGLVNPVFWIGMTIALSAAFVAAYPVNRWLIGRGKGHALTHQHGGHEQREGHEGHAEQASGASFSTTPLLTGLVGFLVAGLVVSVAAEIEEDQPAPPAHGAAR